MAKFNYMAYWQEQQKKLIDSKPAQQKMLHPTKKVNRLVAYRVTP